MFMYIRDYLIMEMLNKRLFRLHKDGKFMLLELKNGKGAYRMLPFYKFFLSIQHETQIFN